MALSHIDVEIGPARMRKSAASVKTKEVRAVVLDQDSWALARAGKKQVLKRRFGLFSTIGLGITITQTWESILTSMTIGILNGGPSGIIYSAFFTWIGTISIFISLGELASMYPTASGQYHWACLMSPPSIRKLYSYLAGWVTVITWLTGPTAASYFTALQIQQVVVMSIPSYEPKAWQALLMMWAVLGLTVLFNTVLFSVLPFLEIVFLFLHTTLYFAILIPLVYLAPKNSAHEVFTTFNNGGGWVSVGLSFMVGLQGNAAALLGGDGAVHMSEETQNSNLTVPRSMLIATFFEGFMGISMLLAFMFCAGPLQELIDNKSPFPYIDIVANGMGSKAAAIVVTSCLVVMGFCGAVGGVSSGSRMVWSFARDQGVPFWKVLRKVRKDNGIPVSAVMTVAGGACVLGLIQLGSSLAIAILCSLVLEGWYTSYICVLIPLLYHRLRGNITAPSEEPSESTSNSERSVAPGKFEWGPWRVNPLFGTINNIFAVAYLLVVSFFCYWPSIQMITPGNMNYASAILGGVAIFSTIYYIVWARKSYSGPIVEITVHAEDNQPATVIEEKFDLKS